MTVEAHYNNVPIIVGNVNGIVFLTLLRDDVVEVVCMRLVSKPLSTYIAIVRSFPPNLKKESSHLLYAFLINDLLLSLKGSFFKIRFLKLSKHISSILNPMIQIHLLLFLSLIIAPQREKKQHEQE